MSAEARLASMYAELGRLGLRCLVMGGHAVRFHGVERNTADFDLCVALDDDTWERLGVTLAAWPALGVQREGTSWRPGDFRRFVVGRLADGRDETLELWRRNHLLAPLDELHERRVEGVYGGGTVAFLGIEDLIRSKETEREDDWADVALLEEIADQRRLAAADSAESASAALAHLRSRRGFEAARAASWSDERDVLRVALGKALHPLAQAYLAPFAAAVGLPGWRAEAVEAAMRDPLARATPGSPRHLALVEAARRLYRRAAMEADRRDKERAAREGR